MGARIGMRAEDSKGMVTPPTESERIQGQIDRGEVDASEDAARRIAQEIEDAGGFWGPRKS